MSDCLDDQTLKELADGRLPAEARDAAEAHLAGCERCRGRKATWVALAQPSTDATFIPGVAGYTGTELRAGDRIGPYQLAEPVGRGGMGVVWRARDPRLDRWVALKVVRAEAAEGTQGRVRLLREAQAMARLSHPNVVAVHDVGEAGDGIFVAMELVEGKDLADWLFERPRTWREILPVFVAAARGLAAAHAAGLVHRDFKPANVLVGKDGRARVTDFGLARAAEQTEELALTADERKPRESPQSGEGLSTPLTLAGMVMGTPPFMAPEQLEGRKVDARADQFSFCAALWQALYGGFPYGEGEPARIRAVIARGPPAPPAEGRRIPRWLLAALRRGLAEGPAQRWPSMDALATALERGLGRRRRMVIGAIGVAAAAIWAAGLFATTRVRTGPCAVQPPDVWDAATRESVRRAFEATGLKFAGETMKHVDETLTGLERQIDGDRARACAPPRAGGPATAEDGLLRAGCLDQARSELEGIVSVLRKADADVVRQASDVLAYLPVAKVCQDQRRLMQSPRLPTDPAERVRYLELRSRVFGALALDTTGQKARARAILDEVLPIVRAGHWRALEAAALVTVARSYAGSPDHGKLEEAIEQGWLAAHAAGDDYLATQAALFAVGPIASTENGLPRAERWARIAEATLARMGGEPDVEAQLLRVRLDLERSLGHSARALELAQAALRHDIDKFGAGAKPTLDSMHVVATLLGDLGRYDEQLEMGRAVLEGCKLQYGPTHPETGFAYTAVAEDLEVLQRFPEAIEHARAGLAIQLATVGEKSRDAATTLEALAAASRGAGDFEAALGYARRAVAAFDASLGLENPEGAMALGTLGEALFDTGKPAEAEKVLRRAIAILEKTEGPERQLLPDDLRVLGEALQAQGNPKEAVRYLERALKEKGAGLPPLETSYIEFKLGAARWEARLDRPGARQQVEAALRAYVPPRYQGRAGEKRERAEIDQWLAKHR